MKPKHELSEKEAAEAGSIAFFIAVNILFLWFLLFSKPNTIENMVYNFFGAMGTFLITLFGTAYFYINYP